MPLFDIENFRTTPLPTEEEIMAGWKGDSAKPVVSVICTTYNQESYIADALHSFLMQETEFPFEIIIHDDASTDNTAHIIREYCKCYPKIIKPIYQTENQHSKGKRVMRLAAGYSQGDYIAFCEGDDFWTSKEKLTKQHAKITQDSRISFVAHNAITDTGARQAFFSKFKNSYYFNETDIFLSIGMFAPTASFFFKKEIMEALPSWMDEAPIGDYFYEIYSQKIGIGFFMKDVMSLYRLGHSGSWTSETFSKTAERIDFTQQMITYVGKATKDFPGCETVIQRKIKYLHKALLYDHAKSGNLPEFIAASKHQCTPCKPVLRLVNNTLGLKAYRLYYYAEYRSCQFFNSISRFLTLRRSHI